MSSNVKTHSNKIFLKLVMGMGQKFLTRVRSIFFGSGQVGLGQPFLFGFEYGKFPLNKFFNFFPFWSKKSLRVGSESMKAGWPLIY